MNRALDKLVEQQIAKALAEGKLSNLDGEGKPLRESMPGDFATGVAMRIMAEAGAVPQEFKWKKALDAARVSYNDAVSESERRNAMSLIAELELRYNTAVEARRAFLKP